MEKKKLGIGIVGWYSLELEVGEVLTQAGARSSQEGELGIGIGGLVLTWVRNWE